MSLLLFALSVAASFVIALAFYPLLWLPERRRLMLLVAAVAVLLILPLAIPARARFLRFLAAIIAVTSSLKLYDVHLGARTGVRPTLWRFAVFLWNVFSLVDRRIDARPDPVTRAPLRRLAWSGGATVVAMGLAIGMFRMDWSNRSFALEHAAKAVAFFLVLFPFTAAAAVVWRAAGFPGRDIMHNPFAARTPADFWRRYNRPVHEFLEEDVYKPVAAPASDTGSANYLRLRLKRGRAGRRNQDRSAPNSADRYESRRRGRTSAAAAFRATLLTFVVSAAVHEYVFAVPIGRVQGYQAAFFLLQGLAVAATARVKPRGWRVVPWVIATFAFNLATGVLFFASLNHVVPMYQHPPPLWGE